MREDPITNALVSRFKDLSQARVTRLKPEDFNDAAPFVSRLCKELRNASIESLGNSSAKLEAPNVWMISDLNCLSSLQALALGESVQLVEGAPNPLEPFMEQLKAHKRDPARRFELLTGRYAWPMNFALTDEEQVREHVLERLMVQDRAQILMRLVNRIGDDDLLVKLNLIAVHVLVSRELRFLDALNYYYELLSAEWVPSGLHSWLLASYFGLYARALAVRILREQSLAHSHTLEHAARGAFDL